MFLGLWHWLMVGFISIFFERKFCSRYYARFWVIALGSPILCKWHWAFDPWREKLQKRHSWVVLLIFPVQWWNFKDFMEVGNSIGHFIMIEESSLLWLDWQMLNILIELDITEGLLDEVKIRWDGCSCIQFMDYWKVHFWCFRHHKTRHLQ